MPTIVLYCGSREKRQRWEAVLNSRAGRPATNQYLGSLAVAGSAGKESVPGRGRRLSINLGLKTQRIHVCLNAVV